MFCTQLELFLFVLYRDQATDRTLMLSTSCSYNAFRLCFSVVKRGFYFIVFCILRCIKSAYAICRLFICGRVAVLYAVTFLIVLPNLLRNVRYSLFYARLDSDVLLNLTKSMNSDRIAQAENYFSSLNSSGMQDGCVAHTIVESDVAVTVALTVITVSRNRHEIDNYEPKYLTQTVWKFHSQMEKWRPRSRGLQIHMSICNVDDDVPSYQEANALSELIPMFSRFNRTQFSSVHPLEKEKEDYAFCLNKSLDIHKKADYIFLVEDDALPTDDMFEVLQRVLMQQSARSYTRGEFHHKPSNVAFIKFFHPERLLNFISFQPERLPELISYAALLSTLLVVVVYFYATARVPASTDNWKTVDVLFRQLFLFSLVVMLACGRTGISEWRRLASPHFYSFTPSPSCCTQALLFPREAALLTVNYLDSSTCEQNFGKDSVLDNMLQDLQMTAYLVQPNTFEHIGVYSTLRNHIVDPFLV